MTEDRFDRNLPAPLPQNFGQNPVAFPVAEWEQPVQSVPLSHYVWILKRHRWRILAFVFTGVLATLIISSRITPIYESTVTIDVDRHAPSGVVGPEAVPMMAFDSDQFMATQIRLIQSDSVVRPVARKFKILDFEPRAGDPGVARTVSTDEAPVRLGVRVTRPPNTYLLLISYRSPDPRLASDVSNAIAQSYLEHTYSIRYRSSASLSAFMVKEMEELKAKMERSSDALLRFEREMNVINPEEKTNIISARLLQLNTEYTTAQGDRMRKEAAAHSVQSGSMEAAQASSQGEALRRLAENLGQAQQKFAEVKAHYGVAHPEYKKAVAQVNEIQTQLAATKDNIAKRVEAEYRESLNREAMLQKAVTQQKTELDRLNAHSFEYQTLKREAEADKKFYEELVRKIKEAGINSSFQNNMVRIADPARPSLRPISPNIQLNVLLAFLLSTIGAVAVALVSDVLDSTMRDPEKVARVLNCNVIGTLPLVKNWKRRQSLAPVEKGLVRTGSADHHVGGFEEAVRTLRNSILLADFDRRIRTLLFTSASPAEGKSTIAAHLAIAHAAQKHKTLIIDADLRRPSVHRRFGIQPALGLSSVVLGESTWQESLTRMEWLPDLDILAAGRVSRLAADQVGKHLLKLIEEATAVYDLVILDSPPLLGFAEPLEMARAVDGVVVVTLAERTNRKAVASVLTMLHRVKANVLGIVLNKVSRELGESYYYYGYGYGYYQKYWGCPILCC